MDSDRFDKYVLSDPRRFNRGLCYPRHAGGLTEPWVIHRIQAGALTVHTEDQTLDGYHLGGVAIKEDPLFNPYTLLRDWVKSGVIEKQLADGDQVPDWYVLDDAHFEEGGRLPMALWLLLDEIKDDCDQPIGKGVARTLNAVWECRGTNATEMALQMKSTWALHNTVMRGLRYKLRWTVEFPGDAIFLCGGMFHFLRSLSACVRTCV